MRKTGKILLAAGLAALLLAGCGAGESAGSQTPGEGAAQESQEASGGESVSLKDWKVEDIVTLGDYRGIRVSLADPSVDQDTWDAYVEQVYQSSVPSKLWITDRAAALGDTVNIDYEGRKDGVAFDGGTAQGTNLTLGSHSFIDGFEDGLVGVMPGETKDLELTFPENYGSAELAGQAVVFTVTVNHILPEMTDETVAAAGDESFSTVEELRRYVYDYLMSSAQARWESQLENMILQTFMDQCEFRDIPEDLVAKYRQNLQTTLDSAAASAGVTADVYTAYLYGMDSASFLDTYSVESAKQGLAMQAVANAEGLNLSDEELEEELEQLRQMSGAETVEAALGVNTREDYREYLMIENVIQFLKENVTNSAQ